MADSTGPTGDGIECSPLDAYRLVRSRIEHEDTLVTQRLNWFLASQSFLFSAYALTCNAPAPLRDDARHKVLLAMLPLIAICTSTLVFLTIMAGLIAMRHLHHWLHQHSTAEQTKSLPPVQGVVNTRALGMTAPVLLPPIFVLAWAYLMLTSGK